MFVPVAGRRAVRGAYPTRLISPIFSLSTLLYRVSNLTDEPLVLVVRSDPKPDNYISISNSKCAIVQTHPH